MGVCHGVILAIHPEARIVDITHGIPRHDVRMAALVLRKTLRYMPVGVHVAVVDPGVGSERRALALRCGDGRSLVGPDNGVLSLAWEACGGVAEAVDVSASPHRLEPVSATFHGRDVFAPVAAHLARGAALGTVGRPVDQRGLATVRLPVPRVEEGDLVAHVLAIDRFGNVELNLTAGDLQQAGIDRGTVVEFEAAGERFLGSFQRTFADVRPGEVIVYEDAYRSLAIAINQGDAAALMRLAAGDEIGIRPR